MGGKGGTNFGMFFAGDGIAVDDGKADEQDDGRYQADKNTERSENGRWLFRQRLMVKDVETAQVAGTVWVFPIVFASSIFVPVESMAEPLQAFARVNPITLTVDAVRALASGQPPGDALWSSLAWSGAILLLFVPLAVDRYRRMI